MEDLPENIEKSWDEKAETNKTKEWDNIWEKQIQIIF